jgi:hypothetical protein
MKKFALAAIAAVVATVSLSSVAEARRRHHDDWGWDRPYVDVIVYRPSCSTIKIIKFDDWGNKIVKIIKKCR